MSADLTARVIVLNGGSSSGKSSIARALQQVLPQLWLTFGVDAFIDALPGRGHSPRADIASTPNGAVEIGPGFKACEDAWREGLATMARAGAPLILDEVFLSGGEAQTAMRAILQGLHVLWVGVRCDAGVAADRETHRSDRIPGMARAQAERVHVGVSYDIQVDTTATSPEACARLITAHLGR
jgi:chloramphenicol 3-O phosphotransferase